MYNIFKNNKLFVEIKIPSNNYLSFYVDNFSTFLEFHQLLSIIQPNNNIQKGPLHLGKTKLHNNLNIQTFTNNELDNDFIDKLYNNPPNHTKDLYEILNSHSKNNTFELKINGSNILFTKLFENIYKKLNSLTEDFGLAMDGFNDTLILDFSNNNSTLTIEYSKKKWFEIIADIMFSLKEIFQLKYPAKLPLDTKYFNDVFPENLIKEAKNLNINTEELLITIHHKRMKSNNYLRNYPSLYPTQTEFFKNQLFIKNSFYSIELLDFVDTTIIIIRGNFYIFKKNETLISLLNSIDEEPFDLHSE